MTKRLFLGVPLSEEMREAVANWSEAQSIHFPEARKVPKENYHITLHFLGNVEPEKIAPLLHVLTPIKFKPFDFEFFRVQGFPSSKKAHVIVLAGSDGISPLASLYFSIAKKLETLHYQPERRIFIPHITLFRSNTPLEIPNQLSPPQFKLTITSVQLYESTPTKTSSQYKVIKTFNE